MFRQIVIKNILRWLSMLENDFDPNLLVVAISFYPQLAP